MAPWDSRYTQVGFNLISVQVCAQLHLPVYDDADADDEEKDDDGGSDEGDEPRLLVLAASGGHVVVVLDLGHR